MAWDESTRSQQFFSSHTQPRNRALHAQAILPSAGLTSKMMEYKRLDGMLMEPLKFHFYVNIVGGVLY